MSHAPFTPSATKRWLNCQGSFPLSLLMPPEVESTYAEEGSRLHGLAAAHLTGCDDSMHAADWEAIKPYVFYASDRIAVSDFVAIEQRLDYSPLLFGTPDLLLGFDTVMGADRGLLEVVDLKTGAGIMVDAEENEQLLTYAFMALVKLRKLGRVFDRVRLTIVQPPDEANPVKSWECAAGRVMEHGARVEAAIARALEGDPPIVPGEWCRFCRAKPVCPKLRGEMVEALAGLTPATMTPASLAQWLDRSDRMEGFIKAVREVGHTLVGAGVNVPGWTLKPKRATRQWDDEDKVLEIARRRKIKIYQDKMLSPAMAEKAHPNLPQELRDRIVAVSSGSNLVRGEAPDTVNVKPEATKTERLMANFKLMQHRR